VQTLKDLTEATIQTQSAAQLAQWVAPLEAELDRVYDQLMALEVHLSLCRCIVCETCVSIWRPFISLYADGLHVDVQVYGIRQVEVGQDLRS
jgi:hypothetical protein